MDFIYLKSKFISMSKYLNISRASRMTWMVLLCLPSFIWSCEKSGSQPNEPKKDPIVIQLSSAENKMAQADMGFALNLFYRICEENRTNPSKDNILISPFSMSIALAMVWNGAAGDTKTAIQNTLGFEQYTDTEVNDYYKKMKEALLSTDPSVKLAIANSIWYRKGASINSSFVQTNKNWYDAQVLAADFSSPTAKDFINKWCSDNTNGLINNVIDKTSAEDLIYLLNALYFKGEWSDGYEFDESKTKKGTFKRDDGTTVYPYMMTNNIKMSYFNDETLSAVSLPYGNGAFTMVFALPCENVTTPQMIATLKQPSYWNEMQKNWHTYQISLQVPRFKMKFNDRFNNVLKQMGMSVAFSPFSADFSRAFDDNDFFISFVDQFTYIDVNEKGTEAVAVTVISGVDSVPVFPSASFIADHPFVFAIKENSTGCILFMGKVGDPS